MGWALDAAAMARDTAADGETGAGADRRADRRRDGRVGIGPPRPPWLRSRRPSPWRAPPTRGPRIPEDAIDDARALARAAAPDHPLFVGGAGRLTSSLYVLRERPDARWTGPGRVIEIVGPRGFHERDRARLERRGTFVGRDRQLAELEVWLARAVAADHRHSVLITGAAGIGKSRLVAELVARRAAVGAPLRVTTTAASPASRLAPFATVIDLYQAALGLPPSRGRAARAEVVHRLYDVLTRAGLAADHARAIATDLDRAMELRDGVAMAAREHADLRPRISAGLGAFRLVMASPARPALTVIEDVHLADSASLEVLRHALAMPAHGPELLVLTARPEGPPPPGVDAVLALGDLTGGDLRMLASQRLGDAGSPRALAAVLARGGGNPLFIEELAQAFRDAGAAEDVPASARDVVSARVDRLSARPKTALRFASVLGDTIRVRLLEELLGEDSLDGELDELVTAGFVVRPESTAGEAAGDMAFARGLVREVVYESLSPRARRDVHARVGRLLASRFFAGRDEPPGAIAEHLERGGEAAGAAAFWLRAGRLALQASDADAAIACFTRTLALEHALGAAPATATSKGAPPRGAGRPRGGPPPAGRSRRGSRRSRRARRAVRRRGRRGWPTSRSGAPSACSGSATTPARATPPASRRSTPPPRAMTACAARRSGSAARSSSGSAGSTRPSRSSAPPASCSTASTRSPTRWRRWSAAAASTCCAPTTRPRATPTARCSRRSAGPATRGSSASSRTTSR